MSEFRADPDELLKAIRQEQEQKRQGHLKIFFGYAAGVGKTYAMLKAAHAAKRRGVDVVVGYVEPHARPQTAALLGGLELIPLRSVQHSGIELHEFDPDAVMHRMPQLVLVDELAHTNASGSRHAKRCQDVEELLKAGIDVYTTVNVQHIESLCDMVASVTGVVVRERIPDRVFDNADQVELVDIEPQELLERLNAGKIYRETQAERALEHFFTPENLVALREIALRRCADRVSKISDSVRIKNNSDYYTDEHILVCLSSSPTNPKIIRTAARMADAFRGGFTALFVETPDFSAMSEENKNRLRANIHLAQQLGATIETTYGDDVAFQISEFARLSGVSKIVVGRQGARRKHFLSKPSLTEKLIAYSPNLDIYIIPDRNTGVYRARKAKQKKGRFVPADLIKSILVLIAATLIGCAFFLWGFSEANIITIYILGVLITAVTTTQRIYSLVSSVISVLIFNFFFTDPRFTLNAYDSGYPATFLIMFLAAFLTGSLAVKIKRQARQAARTAYRTKVLLDLNQLLQQADGRSGIISSTAGQLIKLLGRDIVFYPVKQGRLEKPCVFPASECGYEEEITSENEQAVAAWVFQNNKHAGATTGTLSSARCLYLAIRVNNRVYGVVGIVIDSRPLDAFENSILLSMLGECALALESEQTAKEKEEAAILAKNEQLRANLLRSISHDLRTPLTSISGNAGVLLADDGSLNADKRRQLYSDIYDDALWLINLVENLLSVTRIEDGTMQLKCAAELIDEVIDEALRHVNRKAAEHHIVRHQSDGFILARMDARLIIQVLINIVDNAVKYTSQGSTISISSFQKDGFAVVEIADDGPGIPDEAKPHIFDMFYTASAQSADSRRGLGLGLALCRSIIRAHGGEITVQDNLPAGTLFRFTLPAEEVTLHE
ncbi:sensor histidine kinase [Candidatus Soleaferrea massiliensis]|uniref:sensor histidine kinase n=1 Tax=Candidatus Soleaferrea massiliensis TaxID=1470354 RepID=UPI00058F8653|nr:sensor histidine kinase KdpD [Candidatus Soleaferrea massiliensis]